MALEGMPKPYLYLGILFLILFVVLSLMVGYTLLLIVLEVVSTLFLVFFVYGILIGGIESRVESDADEGIDVFAYEKGDLRKRISYRIKRLRDKLFYKY